MTMPMTSTSPFVISDEDRHRLQTVMAQIDHDLSCLSHEGTLEQHRTATRDLVTSWSALTALLALGPSAATRQCPFCQQTCMRLATRCGNCWQPLPPLTPGAPETD